MLLTTLYPNFATFQDSLRSSEFEEVYERRYKLVSAIHGCERPSIIDELKLCRIKVREDTIVETAPKKVKTNEEGMAREVYCWKTPYSIFNMRLNAWVPVIDFNVMNCYPGHFLYTNESESTQSYMKHRVCQQSLRSAMLDRIMNPTERMTSVFPIPKFAANLMKCGAIANNDSCPITMNYIKECSSITLTSCYHLFETDAINVWIRKNSGCPVCKEEITSVCVV